MSSERDTLIKADPQLRNINTSWSRVASDESVSRAVAGLQNKGIQAHVVESRSEALEKLVSLIPDGVSVYNAHSTTLEEIGWDDYRTSHPGKWDDILAQVYAAPMEKSSDIRRQGAIADYFLSLVTAVTEEGDITVCDSTGTRVMGFHSAKNLIVVIGLNKIVPNYVDAVKRTYEYCLPLESARSRVAYAKYGVKGSAINHFSAVRGTSPFAGPKIQVIIVKDVLGF